MDPSDYLIGITEVGAAFVGFSSIVAVFGRRSGGVWEPTDRIRMRNLVEQSLALRIWMASVGLLSLTTALCLQLLNLFGWRFDSEPGPYLAGLLLLLFLAGLQFALLVFGHLGDSR